MRRRSESRRQKEIETEAARQAAGCLMFFVLIQGKVPLRVDRTSYRPPLGFGSWEFAPSSRLSHNSSTLDPLFSQLLSVNVKASFSLVRCVLTAVAQPALRSTGRL